MTSPVLPDTDALDAFPGSARDLDILTVVERLEQIDLGDPATGAFLLHRVLTCDLPRLRAMLPPDVVEWSARARS